MVVSSTDMKMWRVKAEKYDLSSAMAGNKLNNFNQVGYEENDIDTAKYSLK